MGNLSENIEKYLKSLIDKSPDQSICMKRSELAGIFNCVPSQINYVLSTRFTKDKGYLVKSQRGGSGYIEIKRLKLSEEGSFSQLTERAIGDQISERQAKSLILRLYEEKLLSYREREILISSIKRESLPLPLPERDIVRANLLKNVLLEVLK